MTKKHFDHIAAVLNRTQTADKMTKAAYNVIRRDFGTSFATMNPRFDFDKWENATKWQQEG